MADPKLVTLFVATTSKLLKLVVSGKGQGQPARTIEDSGCAAGCMTVNDKTGDIIVVREDAVYYYTLDGRGLCFANDGSTSLVSTYQDYVALVSPPPSSARGSDGLRGRFGGTNTEALFNAARFTMVDPALQIVAHSESLISEVQSIIQIWGDLFVLTRDGKVSLILGVYQSCVGLTEFRSTDITRNLYNRGLSYCTSEIYSHFQSILRKSPAWTYNNRTSSTENTATIYTRKETMTVPWLSTSKPLTARNPRKSSEK